MHSRPSSWAAQLTRGDRLPWEPYRVNSAAKSAVAVVDDGVLDGLEEVKEDCGGDDDDDPDSRSLVVATDAVVGAKACTELKATATLRKS